MLVGVVSVRTDEKGGECERHARLSRTGIGVQEDVRT